MANCSLSRWPKLLEQSLLHLAGNEMRLLLVSLALGALFFCFAHAAPGSYFSKADSEALQTLIKGEMKNGEFGSLANNVAAVEALSLLGSPVSDTSKLCDAALHGMSSFLTRSCSFECRFGHWMTRHVVEFPSSPSFCSLLSWVAFSSSVSCSCNLLDHFPN